MKHHRIDWTRACIASPTPRETGPGLPIDELVRQIGLDRALKLLPELRLR